MLPINRTLLAGVFAGILTATLVVLSSEPAFAQKTWSDRAVNLEKLNSPYSDVAPIVSADGNTLYFTSDRPGGKGGQDFWVSRRVGGEWGVPENISELNTSKNEGPDTITADGSTMYYTGCNRRPDGSDKCDIYVAHKGPDGKWRPGENIGPPINTDYEEANATVSPDGNRLIFASDRPGGLGGYDLWISRRAPDGSWSEPKNLGSPVNTSMWEGVAFWHSDGVTVYFSSNGHGGFGNADIFQTQLNPDGSWAEPVNMGGLINSPYNDIYFSVPAAGDLAYFSSSAEEGFGREDLYAIPKEIIFKSRDYVVVRGRVTDAETGESVAAMLTVTDGPEGRQDTTSNPRTGTYNFRLKIGNRYTISASSRGYFDSTEGLDLTVADPFHIVVKNIKLRPVGMVAEAAPRAEIEEEALHGGAEEILVKGGKLVVRNIMFDFDEYTLRDKAIPVLEKMVEFMEKNPRVRIKVDGYTDSVGPAAYNLRLSIKRAETVKKYMLLRGIERRRIVTEGHGEKNLIAEDDPKYGNIENRRVEFSLVRGTYSPTEHPNVNMLGKEPPDNVITKVAGGGSRIDIPSELTIGRAVVARDVVNKEPRGVDNVFSASEVDRLYYFTRVDGAADDITIVHRWYYNGKLVSRVPLEVTSPFFRTWSYVAVPSSWRGRMRVEAVGPDGKVLNTVRFTLVE